MKVYRVLLLILASSLSLLGQETLEEAAALLEAGHYDKAALIYERLHLADADNYAATLGLGRALFMQHEGNRSLALFEKAGQLAPERAEPHFWQAKVLERRGQIDLEKAGVLARATLSDAHRAYERALAIEPEMLPALQGATTVLFQLLRLEEALVMVDRVLALAPKNERALITRLGLLYRLERYADFLSACEAYSDQVAIDLTKVLDAACRLGRVDTVRTTMLRLFDEGYAGSNRPFEVLSSVWFEGERLEQQIKLLEELLEARPDEKGAWFYLGYAQAVAGRLQEARQAFEAYLDWAPGNLMTQTQLARVARFDGRLDDAVRYVKAVFDQDPSFEAGKVELQEVVAALFEAKRFAEALAVHEGLFRQDPDNSFIVRGHAILLKEQGQLEEAARLLKLLLDEYPIETSRLAAYTNDYALTLKALGQGEAAQAAFRRAIDLWDRQADARENLGVLFYDAGRFSEAEALLQAAIAAREATEGADLALNLRSSYYLQLIEKGRVR